MSCDACKRIPHLTGHPCRYCGRLNVEAEAARKIVTGEGPWPWPDPNTQTRLSRELVAEKMRRIELEAKVRAVLKLLQLQLAKPQTPTFIRQRD